MTTTTTGRKVLPANVRPSHYKITLSPDLDNFTFRGEETVRIDIQEPTRTITLNADELAIQTCSFQAMGGRSFAPIETTLNEKDQTVTFTFQQEIPVSQGALNIKFTGTLNDKLRGFYRSKYRGKDGKDHYLATTQFEATDARRAFPCWDEPSLKARFQINLVIPPALTAVSNMPLVKESRDPSGKKRMEFEDSPIMSTYLVAFVVGDLKYVEEGSKSGTMMRIWATAGNEEKGRYALDVSLRLLDYYNSYFGIPYPLAKMDHIAIPDFAAGAMENWGCITYREPALLVDPANSSAGTRQTVAAVVAHEMAHMWFGDLVTMAWWNDLWLNESFASWMGDKAVDVLHPEWQMWTQFVSSDTNRALSLDGLKNSHPIEQEVNNPDEIGQLFDAISYSKGGSILRMLEHYLGADTFQRGLGIYLNRHQYKNAAQIDLWNAMGEASGKPVAAMMSSWINQTGYPVLDVKTSRKSGAVDLAASQNRFLYDHLVDRNAKDDTLWRVPLAARTDSGATASAMMDQREAKLSIATGKAGAGALWVKVNPEQTGFYRVNYTPEDWNALRPAIRDLALPAMDRLGIQNDAYALARGGYIPITVFLNIAEAYLNETDASVWSDLTANFGSLDLLIGSQNYYPRYQAYARRILQTAGKQIGWDKRPNEGHLDALLRSTLLTALGEYKDDSTLAEARKRFDAYVKDPGSVHPDIRRVSLALTAKRGDRAVYDKMWEMEKAAALEEEKLRLLVALTQFERQDLLEETLNRSLSADVRLSNTIAVVTYVANNRHGRDMAWGFLKKNWTEFDRRYGEGGFGLMRLVAGTTKFTTRDRYEDVESFFKAHPAPAADRTIKQSLELIRINIAWLERNADELEKWFVG